VWTVICVRRQELSVDTCLDYEKWQSIWKRTSWSVLSSHRILNVFSRKVVWCTENQFFFFSVVALTLFLLFNCHASGWQHRFCVHFWQNWDYDTQAFSNLGQNVKFQFVIETKKNYFNEQFIKLEFICTGIVSIHLLHEGFKSSRWLISTLSFTSLMTKWHRIFIAGNFFGVFVLFTLLE